MPRIAASVLPAATISSCVGSATQEVVPAELEVRIAGQVATLLFTATSDFRPEQSSSRASFDRRHVGLVVSGPILILDGSCAVVLTSPCSIPLRR
jgi:hypothetical protein